MVLSDLTRCGTRLTGARHPCAAPKEPTEAEISEMMAAAPDGIEKINWIMFLTMFAEKMEGKSTRVTDSDRPTTAVAHHSPSPSPGTDPEEVIRNAFKCFDSEDKGVMGEEQLKEILTTMGDKKMTPEEVDLMLESAPYDKDGNFDYLQFTKTLKHGTVVKS